jgi:prophage antirepressor-like protein
LQRQKAHAASLTMTAVTINQAAVYNSAFRPSTPAAERLTDWVAADILPMIRKMGGHRRQESSKEIERTFGIARMLARKVMEAERLLRRLDARTVRYWETCA